MVFMPPQLVLSARPDRPAAARPVGRVSRHCAAFVALVAVLASVFTTAAPASAASLPPRTTAEKTIAGVVLTVLNAERKVHGLSALRMNSNLIVAARRHNVTMARYNTMSHQLPGEPYFAKRISLAGYDWTWAGENIAWNSAMTQTGVVTLQKLMYNEKAPNNAHRLNILNTHFRDVGVDVYLDKTHHKVWLTTDFGRR
jgi:uncharacterized protein YkwD